MRTRTALYLLLAIAVAIPLVVGCAGTAAPEKYPTKPVTYLITFDPGGQSDREARRQQPHLERILGQKVTIDYKVGGGGAVGWSELARAKPDGYVFAGFNIPHIILQPLQQESGYKTEQIVPVVIFQATPLGLAVLNSSPYKTLNDYINAAKAKPGNVSVGGSGTLSGPQFAVQRLEKLAGIKLNYVPFTGAAPSVTAFLGGHVDALMANSDDLVKYKDQIRILGFADEKRFPQLPDAPTFKEQNLDIVERVDRGVAVPPGTPASVIKTLESAFLEIAKNPDVQKEMSSQGFVPLAMGAEESKAYVTKMTDVYKKVLAETK